MCEECGQWRLIYARRKLKKKDKQQLERELDYLSFSCGAQLQDCEIPQDLMDVVYIRKLQCNDPVEKLYYAASFIDICVYCSPETVEPWSNLEEFYPQCTSYSSKPKIANAKKTPKTSKD